MSHPADGSGEDGRKALTDAFRILLAHDHPSGRQHDGAGPDDLQRLLATAREDEGPDGDLRRRLSEQDGDRPELDRGRIEASRQAILILDAHRRIRCASAEARRLLALGPEPDRVFDYFFEIGKPLPIAIERPDRKAGVGRLLAVGTRWEGKDAYLVTILDNATDR